VSRVKLLGDWNWYLPKHLHWLPKLEKPGPDSPTRSDAHLWLLALADVIGFLGNELAAQLRLGAGRRLQSRALVADGNHARVDGFVSLGVLASAAVVSVGLTLADPTHRAPHHPRHRPDHDEPREPVRREHTRSANSFVTPLGRRAARSAIRRLRGGCARCSEGLSEVFGALV
jgi:hypothetical protein